MENWGIAEWSTLAGIASWVSALLAFSLRYDEAAKDAAFFGAFLFLFALTMAQAITKLFYFVGSFALTCIWGFSNYIFKSRREQKTKKSE